MNEETTGVIGIFWRTEELSSSASARPVTMSLEAAGLRG